MIIEDNLEDKLIEDIESLKSDKPNILSCMNRAFDLWYKLHTQHNNNWLNGVILLIRCIY